MKTKFDSYCVEGITEGCKYCVRGEKLVLFVSGVCKRNCWYCSLSKKRKDKDIVFANERECKSFKDILKEAEDSRATSAGITGGDPLIFLDRTIKFASELKKKFGKRFHIHIYLPTKFVTEEKLEKLSKFVDEVRFHPEFLINKNSVDEDLKKISLTGKLWKKENIGIELPLIPDKKNEILEFILKIKENVSFANLNEFELSETNFARITKKYKLKEGGYVVDRSLESGKWILEQLEKNKINLKVHVCTAELKNCWQFKNRLKRHKIFKYGKRTEDGNVIYLTTPGKLKMKKTIYDKEKNRTILSEEVAKTLLTKKKIFRIEEFPTYDRIEIEEEEIKNE